MFKRFEIELARLQNGEYKKRTHKRRADSDYDDDDSNLLSRKKAKYEFVGEQSELFRS